VKPDASAFVIPDGGPYLATHSVGCLTNAALEALRSGYLDPWQHRGADAWEHWLRGVDDFRESLALLLDGNSRDFCPQSNLSAGLSGLLSALPTPAPSRNVWLAAEDSFPSLGFVLKRAESLGYGVRLIPRSKNLGQLQTWSDALTPDVCGVLATHVYSNTGVVAPVADIARCCRSAGVLSVVDVAQSAGILPVSVAQFDADVVLGSCVKWLCGGPGAGFIWVRPDLAQRLLPTDIGWFSHAEPFEMDIHSFRFAEGAQRFWGGTPTVAPYVMAAASMRLLAGIGVNAIRAHTRNLQSVFHAELPESWRSRIPLSGIGGTLCISCGGALDTVRRELQIRGAHFDSRGDVVRLSFHLCNSAEQARLLAQAWH
jgi:selenocysteine lyase/cysteine desulfurase